MSPANFIVGVRRARIASFFAVCLILLTVSPFTAPFSTLDDAELTSEISVLDKRPCSKFTDEAVDAGGAAALLGPPVDLVVSLVPFSLVTDPRDRSDLLTVLRI